MEFVASAAMQRRARLFLWPVRDLAKGNGARALATSLRIALEALSAMLQCLKPATVLSSATAQTFFIRFVDARGRDHPEELGL